MTTSPLTEPERIAFAGDWHGNTLWGVACVEHAAERGVEAIVHVGDFGYDYSARFVGGLTNALNRAGIPLLFVDGNHEDHPLLGSYPIRGNMLREVSEMIWHIPRGMRWQWAGLEFLGCGGAHSVDRRWREPGTSWWKEEAITGGDVARCVEGGPADVLVSHDCPTGVPIPGLGGGGFPAEEIALAEEHRGVLRRIVDRVRPRLIVHGHYHRNYRAEVDLGYGRVSVAGLGMDGTDFDDNLWIVDLDEIKTLAR
jgi:Icc-related predicted phosphoesterase